MKGCTADETIKNISSAEKDRLCAWYNASPEEAYNLYLWCTGDGAVCENTCDEEKIFSEKAKEIGVKVEVLYDLYKSAYTLDNMPVEAKQTNGKKGKFIVLEGLDGAGKTTHLRRLAASLTEMGRQVYMTAEPTCTAAGGVIRETLSGTGVRCAEEMAALFLADRVNHNTNPNQGIIQFLDKGIDVVCDRYYYSSLAYQGIDSDLDWLIACNTTCPAILKPDVCVFLDLQPEICARRIASTRLSKDIFETEETIRRIRQRFADVFQRLGERENTVIVSTNRLGDEVAADIFNAVKKLYETESE